MKTAQQHNSTTRRRGDGFIVDNKVPTYVMIPKTGTTSAVRFMNSCRAGRVSPQQRFDGTVKHHHNIPQASDLFVVLREPADRLESLFNYRQLAAQPRADWQRFRLPFAVSVSKVIAAASDSQLKLFKPYLTQCKYLEKAKRSVILCSPDELIEYLQRYLGFSGCSPETRKNVAGRPHGKFTWEERQRVRRVFDGDTRLWNHFCNSSAPRMNATRVAVPILMSLCGKAQAKAEA